MLTYYRGAGGDITIPSEVDWIGEEAFEDNDNIRSVTFPVTDKYPDDSAYVDESAFEGCLNLKKVVFEGNTCIGESAFEECLNLESVNFKGGITDCIDEDAFAWCERLKTVKIASSSNDFYIGEGAFRCCYSLSSVNLPKGCTDIYSYAFVNCYNLQAVTVPSNTKLSGEDIFGYCVMFTDKQQAANAIEEDEEVGRMTTFVADGKKSGYSISYSTVDGDDYDYHYPRMSLYVGAKKFTPKQLTLTVTKNSSAEKWAKKNGVKYGYAAGTAAGTSTGKTMKK
ncbi:MAG: leucine-rich repeat domain-containing protein [Ruminococcus sp.]|nr:leucine-rich repeat domain-containing protein [Ruminococcus sp.]